MQRSWLAPSRICFNILAFSQDQTPTLSLLHRNAGSNQRKAWAPHLNRWLDLPKLGLAHSPHSPRWPWALPSALPDGQAWTSRALYQCQQDLFSQTEDVPASTSNIAPHKKTPGRYKANQARYKLLLTKCKKCKSIQWQCIHFLANLPRTLSRYLHWHGWILRGTLSEQVQIKFHNSF